MKIKADLLKKLSLSGLCMICLLGCTTKWQDKGSFFQTTQTQLLLETKPSSANIFINNKLTGISPLTTTLEYGREVRRKTRSVSYWHTQPGLALFLTLLSLGVYLPFSAIPVDTESSLEPTDHFRGNEFDIMIQSNGFEQTKEKVICRGESRIELKKQLLPPTLKY